MKRVFFDNVFHFFACYCFDKLRQILRLNNYFKGLQLVQGIINLNEFLRSGILSFSEIVINDSADDHH